MEAAISQLERTIKTTYPEITRVFIEAQREITRVFIEAQSLLGHEQSRGRASSEPSESGS